MTKIIDKKAYDGKIIRIAEYYVNNESTIRKTAKHFNLSKTIVHVYLHDKLKLIDNTLYSEYQRIAKINYNERYTRGGNATKLKFKKSSKSIK